MPPFSPASFRFLRDLAAHNTREWFAEHKPRYEAEVQQPALAFIEAFAPRLHALSAHFVADPRKSGGSLFRIHRDTRFSKDKRPYKTAVGIQFRHERGRDVHCPGFYLHIEPGACFAAVGIWRPDGPTLTKLRHGMIDDPALFDEVYRGPCRASAWEPAGDALKTAPRGYPRDHPQIEDLRRKDVILAAPLTQTQVCGPGLVGAYERLCAGAFPLVRWQCEELDLPV